LKPDVVAIQEFNYTSTTTNGVNTPAAFREMIDNTFGTSFVYIPRAVHGQWRHPQRDHQSLSDRGVGIVG
jgi:hypothetical protein